MNEIIMNKIMANKKLVIAVICALVAIILCVSLGVVLSGKMADASGTENTQESETFGTEVFMDTQMQETENTEVGEVVTLMPVSMTASSMKNDLKIIIVDETNNRVSGQNFVITVTFLKSGEAKEYNDHDSDGIIYIKSLEPGDYSVLLHELEGFSIVQNTISAKVKDKLAYEKVDVKNEIKKENEIDASKEDTSNKDVAVEGVMKDTLPLLESHVDTSEVDKARVDLSNFPVAYAEGEAEATLPTKAVIYTYGSDASKSLVLNLNVADEEGLIKDILWKIAGVERTLETERTSDTTAVQMTIAEDKKSVTLIGQNVGSAKLLVEVIYEDETQNKQFSCSVNVSAPDDDTIVLKDLDGNTLYADNEAKKVATVKDYAQTEKFYVNPIYTGWQTIEGKLYYYKEDHTYATGKQVISGVIYEFDETGYLIEKAQSIGIDVSKWQEDIDWKAVAGAGIDFAIIRCGYRGTKTGALVEDTYFKQNIKGATENGIKVGVYFYSQAITEAEAVEEASMALEMVKGYHLQLPIYIDTEKSGGRGDQMSVEERTNVIKAFCETIKNAGYKPGVYSGKWWYMNKVNTSEIEQYHIWVAQYHTECTYPGRYDIWQYTDSGKVPGVKWNADMNICYRTYY